MTEQDLVIGLDSSTTACKAVVWDLQGKAVAVGRAPLPMHHAAPWLARTTSGNLVGSRTSGAS